MIIKNIKVLFLSLSVLMANMFEIVAQPEQISKNTNVILIITDDQGYGDMSCHGNPYLKTPNIDALYDQSAKLSNFHVSPTCAPTRAALLTGHYTNRTGVWHTVGGRSLLRKADITMAEVFTANGYATGIFGKWHLGDNYPFRPQDRGFQEVLVHGAGGVGQGPDYWNNDYFDDVYLHNGQLEKFQGYCTDIWFDNAMKFIDKNSLEGKPFFCYISTNAPHDPFYVGKKYVEPYLNIQNIPFPAFYGMISNFDENLGKLLGFLKKNNLEDNTLLVFMTDNGTSGGVTFKEGDKLVDKGFNAGMRGKKGSMYEGGHRVPCFVRWPNGGIMAGKVIADLTAHIDLMPTFVDLLDLKTPSEITFDGISLKDALIKQSDQLPSRTIITDSQRLEKPVKWRQSSVMKGNWRLINGAELYDISKDPGQKHDVAPNNEQVIKQLRNDYEVWWKDVSKTVDETPAIILCSSNEPVTLLRTHDMHMDDDKNIVAWNQLQIRQGMKSNGWYAVETLEKAVYRFTLMRWPPEAEAGLLSGLPSVPVLPGTTVEMMPPGKMLDIREVGISIGKTKKEKSLDQSYPEHGVGFEIELEASVHKLRAWFTNEEGESFAAYYVKVEKK